MVEMVLPAAAITITWYTENISNPSLIAKVKNVCHRKKRGEVNS
jgi:hypothetical protein